MILGLSTLKKKKKSMAIQLNINFQKKKLNINFMLNNKNYSRLYLVY